MASDPKSQYQQEFYFVAYPFLELPELKSLERECAENRRVRSEIMKNIRATRAKRREVVEKLKPLFAEEKACKERCNEISKRLSELQFNFKNVRVRANAGEDTNTFKSEAEIDREVRKLEAQIKVNPRLLLKIMPWNLHFFKEFWCWHPFLMGFLLREMEWRLRLSSYKMGYCLP